MPNALAYYPNEKYIRKNWEPESLSEKSIRSLAQAQQVAQRENVLSSNLASNLLPIAMVEGWDKYGIVDGAMRYPANSRRDATMQKLGLRMANSDDPAIIRKWADLERDTVEGYRLSNDAGTDQYARLAAAILAEKAHLYGEDKAVERWNGKGRAVEDYYGERVIADSNNHARKVQQAKSMLNHPKNALLRQAYEQMLKGQ